MDCSPPGSTVHGIVQARTLEWSAIPFSRGSSWSSVQTWLSCMAGRSFTIWATREVWDVAKTRDKFGSICGGNRILNTSKDTSSGKNTLSLYVVKLSWSPWRMNPEGLNTWPWTVDILWMKIGQRWGFLLWWHYLSLTGPLYKPEKGNLQ